MPAKTLTVVVTADDIQNGKPGYAESCPIALAVRRLVGHEHVSVEPITGDIQVGALLDDTYRLTTAACAWARHYDDCEIGEPFTFTATLDEGE